MAEVAFHDDIHDRGRPRWSRMRSRLVEDPLKNVQAPKDQELPHIVTTDARFHTSDQYIFGAEKWSVSVSTALVAKEEAGQRRKHKVKTSEKKKPRRRKGLKVTFSLYDPEIIGEGGEDACLPAIEVRNAPWKSHQRREDGVETQDNLQAYEFDECNLLPPTVNCSTVKRRQRVRRIPTSHRSPPEHDYLHMPPSTLADHTTSQGPSALPSQCNGTKFVETMLLDTVTPAWRTNSHGWPEPSIPHELRRMQADEGRVLMSASRNGHRSEATQLSELVLPGLTSETQSSKFMQHNSDPNAIVEALNAPLPLAPRRRRSAEPHAAILTQVQSQVLDAHPAALSLRPKASPRGSFRSIASKDSSAALSISSQQQEKFPDGSPSPHPLSRCRQDSVSPHPPMTYQMDNEHKERPSQTEHSVQLSPLTYVPPISSIDSRTDRTKAAKPKATTSDHQKSPTEKPALREKNPSRSLLRARRDSDRRPSAPFLHHREEAFSSLVHPAYRRSSADSMNTTSSSPSPRRKSSARNSAKPSKPCPQIDESTHPNDPTSSPCTSSDENTALTTFLDITSQLTSQISIPSLALPIAKHSTPKWLQIAIYWFLRGRQGLTKYILLLRNGVPAGSRLSSDSIGKILTQQHVNFFKTWWIVSEVLGERLVSLANSGEMYSRDGDGGGEGDRNAGLFEVTDILVERFKEVVAWLAENEMLPEVTTTAADDDGEGSGRMKLGNASGAGGGKLDMSLWFVDEGFTDDLGALRERLVRPWGI